MPNETVIYHFSNSGENLGILNYMSVEHVEDLTGVDKLTVRTHENLSKRDKLVWKDNAGDWHEHMVDHIDKRHSGSRSETTAECSNSISELYGVIANGNKETASVQSHLSGLLSGTRWTAGTCSNFGSVELELYHKSVRECIAELQEMVDGELVTEITVNDVGVSTRKVSIVSERGTSGVTRQFSYGHNINAVSREIAADEVYTAIKGYGAKIDADDKSDYANRITVTVTSSADLEKWGIVNNHGTLTHNYTTYTDGACTSTTFLERQCRKILNSMSKPVICYSFDVSQIDDDLWRDVSLGNRVMCVDELFSPELELTQRVSSIKRKLSGRMTCTIEIGKRSKPNVEQFKAVEKATKATTGNTSKVASISPITTNGLYTGDLSSINSSSGGGDSIIHQLNGVVMTSGTINFVTQ